jgi:fluoroquinolone resistance protein
MKSRTKSKMPNEINYKTIEKIDFTHSIEKETDFEAIEFKQCTFSSLSGMNFTDCLFNSCNLSNLSVSNTKMQDVKFKDCKIIGVNFYEVKEFGFSINFEGCVIDYASFSNKKMNVSVFKNCKIHGVNFTMTDLSRSSIEHCDLTDSIFSGTNLSGMDLTTIYNFSINPTLNNIKKARFSSNSLSGLLSAFDIIIE